MAPWCRRLASAGVWLLPTVNLTGCDDPWPLDRARLQIVAVKADPPEGIPGGRVQLELVHEDMVVPNSLLNAAANEAAPADPARSPVRVAWFGGCHNPSGSDYAGCLPGLRELVAAFPGPLDESIDAEALPAGTLGMGTTFSFTIPEDILRSTRSGTTGVSYVFFAACRGELRPRPELQDRVPVACYGAGGEELGTEHWATGFVSVGSYPELRNSNPSILGLRVQGVTLERGECNTDDDCAVLGSGEVSYGCGDDEQCWPLLQACEASAAPCEPLGVDVLVSPSSAEALPEGTASRPRETLSGGAWSAFVTLYGVEEFYPGHGDVPEAYRALLARPPVGTFPLGVAWPLIAAVHDSRGGTDWVTWSFLVSE